MSDPQSYRPSVIPTDPGVYRFYDQHDRVIYVGKARNLRARLTSYFQSNLTEKTYRMVHTAVRVDWTIVKTEVEALQLEYTWIKSENPRFNIQFKDDKSYPYLAISVGAEYPRLFISRAKKRPGVKYFGPYAHAWALRSTFDLLLKIYPVRSCSDSNFQRAQRTKRQCLLGDIGKCAAPCVEWVSREDHAQLAKNLVRFLDAHPGEIESELEREMARAAEAEEYELAARIRDQLSAFKKSGESTENSLPDDFSGDLFATHEEVTHAGVSMFSVRHGRVVGSRSWIIDRADVLEEQSVMESLLPKVYNELDPPKEVLIDSEVDGLESLETWLRERAGRAVHISIPQRGEKFELMQTVHRNAWQALVQFLSKRASDAAVSGQALEEIAETLELDSIPLRIECFDISNIQGTNMVASMVVFEDGLPKKSQYRRFAITDERVIDDTRAMYHVIQRRMKRFLAERDIDMEDLATETSARPKFAYPPQLIVVDGGAPQVSAAYQALTDLGLTGEDEIAIVGLAKRLEEVWLPGSPDPVIFPRHSEGLFLLQRIRDEAHRFAITYHRSKRSKLMLESLLDEIPNLGEVRRSALLERFGTVAALRKASAQELSEIPGIGPKLASLIVEHLPEQAQSLNTSSGELS